MGEPRIGFDPKISEWGNPSDYILLLLRTNARSVPTLGRYTDPVGSALGFMSIGFAAMRLTECKTRYF